jgi:hypothetical protein
MTSFQDVVNLVPTLNPSQITKLKFLLSSSALPDAEIKDWLIDGFISELESKGLRTTTIPLYKLSSHKMYKTHKATLDQIKTFFEELGDFSLNEKRCLGCLLAKCLIHHLESWCEISLLSLIQHSGLCIDAFEKGFPGYIQSHMILFLIRAQRG